MDWIFGSFYLPRQWPSSYGIDAKLPSSLVGQLAYPLMPQSPQVRLPEAVTAESFAENDVAPLASGGQG
jgi:hypothetical protein